MRQQRLKMAVDAGVRFVMLRDHEASPEAFGQAGEALIPWLLERDVQVVVNTRVGRAEQWGTGAHVGTRGPAVDTVRSRLGDGVLIGYSMHRGEAVPEKADYVTFSPVFPTSSKPGHPGEGLQALRDVCRQSAVPVYALGGVTPARLDDCREAGAAGVAVLSAIMEAEEPASVVRQFLRV
ncbi:MAG: thiamine phosphate synthase [Bacteroidota bacterium]